MRLSLFEPKYIRLRERISPEAERLLGEAIKSALLPVRPDPVFVERLGEDLMQVAVARHRFRRHVGRGFLILVLIAGGLLPIVGILLLWWLWRYRGEKVRPPFKPATLFSAPASASTGNS